MEKLQRSTIGCQCNKFNLNFLLYAREKFKSFDILEFTSFNEDDNGEDVRYMINLKNVTDIRRHPNGVEATVMFDFNSKSWNFSKKFSDDFSTELVRSSTLTIIFSDQNFKLYRNE